ncbi:hypothetical protein [Novosphingobium rosa]|uniref:hypothetical protein n=1 Tax=Novosphingobium rosa TaxID=76978 RepID=UPI0008306BC5|nr:hypothetical protein [Novosphingobium rosa]
MSNPDDDFSTEVAQEALADAKRLVEDGARAEAQQLELLGVPSPEAVAEARQVLGPNAGALAVTAEARRRAGRPKGAKNRRTNDFRNWLLSLGHQHPAVTLMQIQGTPPELLMAASRREYLRKDKNGVVFTHVEEMSYDRAQALRTRCAESVLPFVESKMPTAMDMSFSGVSDLIMAGVTHTDQEVQDILDAEFMPVEDYDDDDGSDGEPG